MFFATSPVRAVARRRDHMKIQSLVLASTLATVFIFDEAHAFRKYLEQFTEHYDSNQIDTQSLTDAQSCGLCHVRAGGGGKRTPYGEDFRNIAKDEGKGFPGIEFLDSDTDGFVNLEEIFLQTAPGKSDSAPAGRIELILNDAGMLDIRSSLACSKMKLKAFGFSFDGNATELELNNFVSPTQLKLNGTSGALLAKCADENLVGSLQR